MANTKVCIPQAGTGMIEFLTNWYMTRGDGQSAWARCLPIWHRDGGINDWRGIVGRPFYSPSRGVRLSKVFARRHSNCAAFIVDQVRHPDPVTALCAIDLLVEMASVSPQIIPMLTGIDLPLGQSLHRTLTSDAKNRGYPKANFDTVGSYFRWLFELGE